MDNISRKKKRKGGQAREKEKNKKLLSLIGQKCEKINSYFKGADHENTSILQNVEHEQEIDFKPSTFSSNSNTSLDLDINVQNKGADHNNTSILEKDEHEREINSKHSTFSINSNKSIDLDVIVQDKETIKHGINFEPITSILSLSSLSTKDLNIAKQVQSLNNEIEPSSTLCVIKLRCDEVEDAQMCFYTFNRSLHVEKDDLQ